MNTNRVRGVVAAKIRSRTVRPRLFNSSPEASKAILEMKLDDRDQGRIKELSVKNQAGNLSPEERNELDLDMQAGYFLDLIRANALVRSRRPDNSKLRRIVK